MKKRVISVLLCVAMAATLVTGCGGSKKAKSTGSKKMYMMNLQTTREFRAAGSQRS